MSCPILCDPMNCSTPGFPVLTISLSLLKLMSIESVIWSNHLILCLFFSCFQSFPASGSFPMSWLFTSGGQGIGASASVLPMNIQGWFPLGLTSWSSCCPRDSQKSSPAPQFENINSLTLSILSEKAMATHSSTLAWKIPWAEGPAC